MKDKLKKRLFFCWMVATVQGVSGWIMLSKAQTLQKATGSWLTAPAIIAAGVLLTALVAIFFAGRFYDELKLIEKKENEQKNGQKTKRTDRTHPKTGKH